MSRVIFSDSDEKRWFRDEPDDSDDLVPLSHPVMREALERWKRLSDAELVALSGGQRRWGRENRK